MLSFDRRKLLALARDLLNSDYAGHRLTFQLFAQAPPFAHLAAVYRNFDWDGSLQFVRKAADLSPRVMDEKDRVAGDKAVTQWFDAQAEGSGGAQAAAHATARPAGAAA